MTFVDPEVTKLKLDNEIECWHASAPLYRKRGWILLERNGIEVDVGFLAQLSLGGQSVPVMTACVRFDYTNYDVWPPSVEFIDPCTTPSWLLLCRQLFRRMKVLGISLCSATGAQGAAGASRSEDDRRRHHAR